MPSLERHGRVSLARLIDEHGADTGLPDLWQSLAGDCQHARSAALNNRCAIFTRNCRRCSCRAGNPSLPAPEGRAVVAVDAVLGAEEKNRT